MEYIFVGACPPGATNDPRFRYQTIYAVYPAPGAEPTGKLFQPLPPDYPAAACDFIRWLRGIARPWTIVGFRTEHFLRNVARDAALQFALTKDLASPRLHYSIVDDTGYIDIGEELVPGSDGTDRMDGILKEAHQFGVTVPPGWSPGDPGRETADAWAAFEFGVLLGIYAP